MIVKAEFKVPVIGKRGHRRLAVFNNIGSHVIAYDIDAAMDTDTDAWQIQLGIGNMTGFAQDMLDRDAEVRVNLFAIGSRRVQALHSGFADEITLDETGLMNIQGRDITAVAVDSQHPPQVWHGIRPEVLVAKEARALKIGDRMKLTKARGFKTYATDGSESYWQVWYRFYRKRRMWMWAEPDATLNAMELHYDRPISYHFGRPYSKNHVKPKHIIPVERLEWRSNKSQRVGEVFYFGHRGDVGFLGRADDPTTRMWIKRPRLIIASGDAHNQAEARVEAWEEIFESKVGANEIKLTVADPGYPLKQDRMAFVNLPSVGLTGQFYVVGVESIGSTNEGHFKVVRLREKNYAVSRRNPSDPVLNAQTVKGQGGADNIAANLDVAGPQDWNQFFINAAAEFHGPWAFDLFLGVLLAICEQETGFRNVRNSGNIEYPGTDSGTVPPRGATENKGQWSKFVLTFANEVSKGVANRDYAVGPMQLLTLGYKLLADRYFASNVGNEILGGRWDPESNIRAAGAALASKLGAGVTVSPSGEINKGGPNTGLSLQPTEANIWQGVGNYGEGAAYAASVRKKYNDTYKAVVGTAVTTSQSDVSSAIQVPGASSAELRSRVLNNDKITFTRQSQRDDISTGKISDHVLVFLMWFTANGWPVTISALRSDHSTYTTEGNVSAHGYGLAVDMKNYNSFNPRTPEAMKFIAASQRELQFNQMIGPDESLVIPPGHYDRVTLDQHKSHIHMGWAIASR